MHMNRIKLKTISNFFKNSNTLKQSIDQEDYTELRPSTLNTRRGSTANMSAQFTARRQLVSQGGPPFSSRNAMFIQQLQLSSQKQQVNKAIQELKQEPNRHKFFLNKQVIMKNGAINNQTQTFSHPAHMSTPTNPSVNILSFDQRLILNQDFKKLDESYRSCLGTLRKSNNQKEQEKFHTNSSHMSPHKFQPKLQSP